MRLPTRQDGVKNRDKVYCGFENLLAWNHNWHTLFTEL